MTKRSIIAVLAALAASILLPLTMLAGLSSGSHAAAAPAQPQHAQLTGYVIFGPCNILQQGEIMVIRGVLYECIWTGFGYYWVRYTGSCGGALSTTSREASYYC